MTIPHNGQPFLDARGQVTPPWRAFLSQVRRDIVSGAVTQAQVEALIADALGEGTTYSFIGSNGIVAFANGSQVSITLNAPLDNLSDVSTEDAAEGDVLMYQAGVWSPGTVDSTVPFFVADGDSYTVNANKQALFTLPIELEGTASLVIDGALVEVS